MEHWLALVRETDFPTLVAELLEKHYDPHYQRSQTKNYADYADGQSFVATDLSLDGIRQVAPAIIASAG